LPLPTALIWTAPLKEFQDFVEDGFIMIHDQKVPSARLDEGLDLENAACRASLLFSGLFSAPMAPFASRFPLLVV